MFLSSLNNTYLQLPKPVKSTIWITICNFILAGLGFITAPLFTRLIPESEYGLLSIILTYEQIILILATWEIHYGAYQRGIFRFKEDNKIFTTSTLLLTNLITVVFFFVVSVFLGKFTSFTGISRINTLLLFFYMVGYPAYFCWMTRKKTSYDYRPVVIVSLIFAIVNIVIPLLAVLYINATANVKFGATLVISIILYSFFYARSINIKNVNGKKEIVKLHWKYLIAYEAPLVLHSLSFLILNQADRVMIGKMVGNEQAAFYSVAYNLAAAIVIFQNSINQALTPWRFQQLENKNYQIIRRSTEFLLLLVGGVIISFVLVAPELMKILFTENYYEGVWCIPPISISMFFMFLYSIFVNVETYYEKTKYVTYASVACGVINILLNYIFIPKFGYIAGAYTTLVSYVVFALFHYIFMIKVCHEAIPGIIIFSKYRLLLISVGMIILSVLLTLLYPYILVRYTILMITIFVGIVYRERIKGVFNIVLKK